MSKSALITGITGQDGSYLAEFLLRKGYSVYGIIRRASTLNTERISHILDDIELYYGDLIDTQNINSLISKQDITEIYNLGAQSHVKVSFEMPEYTTLTNSIGTLKLLEAIKNFSPHTKFYQAGTSEMIGGEGKEFNPKSPYAISKLYSHWITKIYRECYHIFACNGILFNHESERRGKEFVSRKITLGIKNILSDKNKFIHLGNLNSIRDWGYAPEYVEGMWKMLQVPTPDDYTLATGETHSVREFVEEAFRFIDIDIHWDGKGLEEKGIDKNNNIYIKVNKRHIRPLDVEFLCGDYSKAKQLLNWEPKTKFKDLVRIMMEKELND